jgi:phosphoglycerate dehydrogenase-like enzyme
MIKKISLSVLGKSTHPMASLIKTQNLGQYMNYNFIESPADFMKANQSEAAFILEGTPKIMDSFLEVNPQIKWVHSSMAGLDWIMCDRLKNSKITLTNAKGCYNESLAEFVTFAIIHFAKKMPERVALRKAKKWEKQVVNNAMGSTVTIVGYGSIGSTTAKMLKNGLRCKITGVTNDPELLTETQKSYVDQIISDGNFDHAIATSDYVVGILPKTVKTTGFFNRSFFNKMKKGSVFINIGRGPTLIEDDLLEAINSKTIYGSGLDVYPIEPLPPTSKLWDNDNVLMTYHDSDYTVDYFNLCVDGFKQELERYVNGLKPIRITNKEKGY